ncbi:MAG: SDR family NAD(P)-dependent oxidoreductase [Planctomycetia bacterium]
MTTHLLQPSPAADRRPRRRRVDGLRVLVTGGSSGVGRALAIEFARRGARVLATARRTERLADLERSVPGITTVSGDITAAATRRQLLEHARDRLDGLDVLVAAAGGGAIGAFRDATPETLRTIMELDFFAPAELVREALSLLAAGRDPAIVLVGSILGCHPLPLHAEYCAAKAALASLAASLRTELADDGIDVLLASLGPTESEFWDSLAAGRRPAWSAGRPLTAATTAAAIVDALVHRRSDVLPGWAAKGYALAARACPWLIDMVVARRRRMYG